MIGRERRRETERRGGGEKGRQRDRYRVAARVILSLLESGFDVDFVLFRFRCGV